MNHQALIIGEIVNWIDNNICTSIKIDDVALRAGYSRWHLQRIFLKVKKTNLGSYIRNKRLEMACSELIESSASIIDISVKYGYESQQAFTRSFIRKYSIPPGAFRRKHKCKKSAYLQ